jgi:tRNA nucleotidyltransferase (CCA-adding enzyme)
VQVARYHGDVHRAEELRPGTILKLLAATDVFRKPERFGEFVDACECDFRGRPGYEQRPYPPKEILRCAAAAARAVDAGAIALEIGDPGRIPAAIEAARLKAVTEALAGARQR